MEISVSPNIVKEHDDMNISCKYDVGEESLPVLKLIFNDSSVVFQYIVRDDTATVFSKGVGYLRDHIDVSTV